MMKKQPFRLILIALALAVLFSFSACSAPMRDSSGMPGSWESAHDIGEDSGEQPPQIAAGQLTAAEWNDLKNYDFWLNLITPSEASEENGNEGVVEGEEDEPSNADKSVGAFSALTQKWSISGKYRIPVTVTAGGEPVFNLAVTLYDDDGDRTLYTARTDVNGRAYLYGNDETDAATVRIDDKGLTDSKPVTVSASTAEVSFAFTTAPPAPKKKLQLMFVIDTTGSMGDEITYLKAEVADVIGSVATATGAEITVALLLYRDIGDQYVTQLHNFSSLSGAVRQLNEASAGGGGDYPEAVDQALHDALQASWDEGGDTVKLLFHILDAPPHDKQENLSRFGLSVRNLAAAGIRILPVASSGADTDTQFLMRAAAILTGGTYIFLTDDSGIGNPHDVPVVGDFVVEYLNALLIRVISEYYTGVETDPIPYSQQN